MLIKYKKTLLKTCIVVRVRKKEEKPTKSRKLKKQKLKKPNHKKKYNILKNIQFGSVLIS
jgi:hypothetical protein